MKQTKADLQAKILLLKSQLKEQEKTIKELQLYKQQHKSCQAAFQLVTLPPDRNSHEETLVEKASSVIVDVEIPTGTRSPANEMNSTPDASRTNPDSNSNTALIDAVAHSDSNVLNNCGVQKRKRWEYDAIPLLTANKRPRYQSPGRDLLPQDAIITAIVVGMTCDLQPLPTSDSATDPMSAAKVYAHIISTSQTMADLASCIASFQSLIFHSLCAVLEHCRYSTEEIDEVMRIRSSKSTRKNLKRLRTGAVWASKVISESTKGGWSELSDRIAERYFDCNVKMSIYGSLADSTKPYFVKMFTQAELFNNDRLPRSWCIPAMVKLVAGSISLEDIYTALGYGSTCVSEIKGIVGQYQEGINSTLMLQQDSTLRKYEEATRSTHIQLSQWHSQATPRPSKATSSAGVSAATNNQTSVSSSAGQEFTAVLPVHTLSNEDNFADEFELSTTTMSEYELSVFASLSDFDFSLPSQQLLGSAAPVPSTSG